MSRRGLSLGGLGHGCAVVSGRSWLMSGCSVAVSWNASCGCRLGCRRLGHGGRLGRGCGLGCGRRFGCSCGFGCGRRLGCGLGCGRFGCGRMFVTVEVVCHLLACGDISKVPLKDIINGLAIPLYGTAGG